MREDRASTNDLPQMQGQFQRSVRRRGWFSSLSRLRAKKLRKSMSMTALDAVQTTSTEATSNSDVTQVRGRPEVTIEVKPMKKSRSILSLVRFKTSKKKSEQNTHVPEAKIGEASSVRSSRCDAESFSFDGDRRGVKSFWNTTLPLDAQELIAVTMLQTTAVTSPHKKEKSKKKRKEGGEERQEEEEAGERKEKGGK